MAKEIKLQLEYGPLPRPRSGVIIYTDELFSLFGSYFRSVFNFVQQLEGRCILRGAY